MTAPSSHWTDSRSPLATLALAIVVTLAAIGLGILPWLRPKPIPVDDNQRISVLIDGRTMGSTYSIRYLEPPNANNESVNDRASDVRTRVHEILDQIDQELSTWRKESLVNQFNRHYSTDWFEVPLSMVELVESTRALTQQTGGKYDITVNPLVDLWGFGAAGRRAQRPSTQEITDALKHVGIQHLETRRDPPALRKTDAQLGIDFSSLAAGEAADRIAAYLRSIEITDFYIDVTGEIVVSGTRQDNSSWSVGIARPEIGSNSLVASVSLSNSALATSGNYRNFAVIEGQLYGHTLDATTGSPAESDLLSVTVKHSSCRVADMLATALMAHDAATALSLANQQGWEVLLVQLKNSQLLLTPSQSMQAWQTAQ